MSALPVTVPKNWYSESDDEGHVDYTTVWGVETTDPLDGPDVAWTAAGLPTPGSSLNIGNTVNPWASFNRKGSSKLTKVDANRKYWDLTIVFTTRPMRRCASSGWTDPLLEPHRCRGSLNKVMEEQLFDNSGDPIQNSSEQRYTGSIVQIPRSRPTVELEMNVGWINLGWLAEYADAVNNATWWFQPARSIKCTVGPWERVAWGVCKFYFVVRFSFELRYETWDLKLLDEGTRVKVAGAAPARWVQYKDEKEENAKTLLDGAGNALAAGAAPHWNTFRVLKERDFSAFGWPVVIF